MAAQTCALCPAPAVLFCVNDDAALCAACDATVHAGNALLARHERRPLHSACSSAHHDAHECASAAAAAPASPTTSCGAAPSDNHSDVAVVPELVSAPAASAAVVCAAALLEAPAMAPAAPAFVAARHSFDAQVAGRGFAADLLDFDLPLLDFDFKPADMGADLSDDLDCVVPGVVPGAPAPSALAGLDDLLHAPAASPYASSGPASTSYAPAAPAGYGAAPFAAPVPAYHAAPAMVPVAASASTFYHPASTSGYYAGDYSAVAPSSQAQLVPQVVGQAPAPHATVARFTLNSSAKVQPYSPAAVQQQARDEDPAAREERLRRYRQQKRAKRNLGRTVRYQSRKAYAMIRPRIKGRFVSPEEWEAHLAAQAGGMPAPSLADVHEGMVDAEAAEAIVPVF